MTYRTIGPIQMGSGRDIGPIQMAEAQAELPASVRQADIFVDFYAQSGDYPSIVSAPIAVKDRIRNKRWFTSQGDEVQKEIVSYDKRGRVEVYEAIFPSGAIDPATNIAELYAWKPALDLNPIRTWSGATTPAETIKNRLRTVFVTGGTEEYYSDYINTGNPDPVVLKSGEYIYQTKQWAPFRTGDTPLGGIGCHYYVTHFKDHDAVQVDLMISNAALTSEEIEADPVIASTTCQKRYYDKIYASLNTGDGISSSWGIYSPVPRASYKDGSPGMAEYAEISLTANEIVTAQPTKENLFPPEAWSYRRHYYYLGNDMKSEVSGRGQWKHVGVASGEYSYNRIPAYAGRALLQPQIPRPDLFNDREGMLQGEIDYLTTAYAIGSGVYDGSRNLHADAYGFFQPMLQGNDSAGLAGGGWITPCIGWHPTPLEYWCSDLWCAGRIERHRKAQFSISDGRILQPEDWLNGSNEIKFFMTAYGGYTNHENDAFDRTRDLTNTLCDYESELYGYLYTASSHLSRTTMHSTVLAWGANDELAKDVIRVIGSSIRHTCTNYNNAEASQPVYPYEESINWKLARADWSGHGWVYENTDQTANPGGVSGGASYNHQSLARTDAWMIDAIANDYCLTPPTEERRSLINDQLRAYGDLFRAVGSNRAGLVMRGRGSGNSQGSVNAWLGGLHFAMQYDLIHQFEHGLVMQGLNTIYQRASLTGNCRQDLKRIIYRNAHWMYKMSPYVGDDSEYGVPHNIGVAYYTSSGNPPNPILMPFHTCSGGWDWWHMHKVIPNAMIARGSTELLPVLYQFATGSTNLDAYMSDQFYPNLGKEEVGGGEPNLQYSAHIVAHIQQEFNVFPRRRYGG